MKRIQKRRCKACGQRYKPDPRTAYGQQHCSFPTCRKASKANSQRRWLAKPENRDYFRGPEQVDRVRRWRQAHPGYWRNKRGRPAALQETITAQPAKVQAIKPSLLPDALQDVFLAQPTVLLGIIASLAGSALQEDIARMVHQLHTRGQMILGMVPGTAEGTDRDRKTCVGVGANTA